MEFNSIHKNYLSLLTMFLLIIVLSQTKTLKLFYDTPLGRLIIIIFILIISYTNPILGIVSVLLIVIMFNYSMNNVNYFESFTTDASNNAISKIIKNAKPNAKNITKKAIVAKKEEVAQEGFDLIGSEDVMRKSKQSNSMPVVNVSRSSENAEPFTGFDGIYTAY